MRNLRILLSLVACSLQVLAIAGTTGFKASVAKPPVFKFGLSELSRSGDSFVFLTTDNNVAQGTTKTLSYDYADISQFFVGDAQTPPPYPPSTQWTITNPGGTQIASNSSPNGWQVSFVATTGYPLKVSVTCPLASTVGTGYGLTVTCSQSDENTLKSEGFSNLFPSDPYFDGHQLGFALNVIAGSYVGSSPDDPSWMAAYEPIDRTNQSGKGASAGFGANNATGVRYENPGEDITVSNPFGPNATYSRQYTSSLATRALSSPGLSVGWTDNLWFRIQILSASQVKLLSPNGSEETFNFANGSFTPVKAGTPYVLTAAGTAGSWTEFELYGGESGRWIFGTFNGATAYLSQVQNTIGINPSSTTGREFIWRDSSNGYRVSSISADAAQSFPLLSFTYSGSQLSQISDARSGTPRGVRYHFDGNNNLSVVTRVQDTTLSDEYRWQYSYSTMPGPNGVTWTLLSNTSAATGAQSQADGATGQNAVTYDPNSGKVIQLVDAKGNKHQYTYHPDLGKTDVSILNADTTTAIAYSQKYNASNLYKGSIDANGNQNSVTYADETNPNSNKTFQDRDGRPSSENSDQFGNTTQTVDVTGVVTKFTYQYDATYAPKGRLKKSQNFDKNGINSKPPTVYYYYGENGETSSLGLLREIDAPIPGDTTLNSDLDIQPTYQFSYTAAGNVSTMYSLNPTGASGWVQTTYTYTDANNPTERAGHPILITGPQFTNHLGNNANVIDRYGYDDKDRVVWKETAKGTALSRTSYVYAEDRLAEIDFPSIGGTIATKAVISFKSGIPTVIDYYRNGTIDREIGQDRDVEQEVSNALEGPGFNNPIGAARDALFRPTQESSASAVQTFNSIGVVSQFLNPGGTGPQLDNSNGNATDKEGHLQHYLNGRGTGIAINRNVDGTVQSVVASDPNYPVSDSFVYDNFGRLYQEISLSGTVTYTYDTSDNPVTVDYNYSASGGPSTYTVQYAYNAAGYRTSLTIPFRFQTIDTTQSILYYYNAAGMLTNLRTPWGIGGLQSSGSTPACAYAYDSDGSLKKTIGRLSTAAYTYNERGNLKSLANTNAGNNSSITIFQSFFANYSIQDTSWLADGRFTKFLATNSELSSSPNLDYTATLTYATNADFGISGVHYYNSSQTADHPILQPIVQAAQDSHGNQTVTSTGTPISITNDRITNSNYQYDNDGGEKQRVYPGDNIGGSQRTVIRSFDPLKRLCLTVGTNGGTNMLGVGYLADGKRAYKDSNPTGANRVDGQRRWFIYDGDSVLAEIYQNSNAPTGQSGGGTGGIGLESPSEDTISADSPVFTTRFDVWAAYLSGPSGIVETWRMDSNTPTQIVYDLFGNPTNRLRVNSSSSGTKTRSIYAPTGLLLGDFSSSIPGGIGYSWANDPIGPYFQQGAFSDEETRQYTNGAATGPNAYQTSLLGQALVGKKVFDPVEGRYVTQEERFKNTYVDTGDNSFYGEHYDYVLTMFDIASYMPVVGSSVQICQGIDEWQSGNKLEAGMHFGFAALGAFEGAAALGEARGALTLGQEVVDTVAAGETGAVGFAKQEAKRIVVGEDMDRVIEAAKHFNAEYYEGFPGFVKGETSIFTTWRHNRNWLKQKLAEGYEIIDIGINSGQKVRGKASTLERRFLNKRNISRWMVDWSPIQRPY